MKDKEKIKASGWLRLSRNNGVEQRAKVEWKLRHGDLGLVFSAMGDMKSYDNPTSEISGQCLDEILITFPKSYLLRDIVKVWREWHLNDMTPGLPSQEAFAASWRSLHRDAPRDDYDLLVAAMKAAGIYEVVPRHTDLAYGGFPEEVVKGERGYHYGECWIHRPLPDAVVATILSWTSEVSETR